MSYAGKVSVMRPTILAEGGCYIGQTSVERMAAQADAELARKDERIATLERLLGVVLDQYTFCVDTDPNDADIAEARALLEQKP